MRQKDNVSILNFWWAANYGANLTAYALQQLIENSILVDNSDFQQNLGDCSQNFHRDFAKKYLNTTSICSSTSELINLNSTCNTFIVGSDQVFRPSLNKNIAETFLLNFASEASKKVAFSASFGVDKEKFLKENSIEKIEQMKKALATFDYLSVREKSGVEICKDVFGINSELIIDPVFILEKSKYDKLILNSKMDFSNKIVSCIFEKQDNSIDKVFEQKYKKEVVELWHSNLSIEDWLNAIKNCEFLITNSYHAMCFAIIFNRPFIALSKDMGASARFESLFEILNIKDQNINNLNEILQRNCIFDIDYDAVNKCIEEERQRGLEFLKKALESQIKVTKEKVDVRINYLENKVLELEHQATLKFQIKKGLWNLWLIIFHKYLPSPVKKVIRYIRERLCK